jgi:hypothetical protein
MMRWIAYALAMTCCAVMPLRADEMRPPDHVALDGGRTVPLAAHARRTHLLGAQETYTLAVYVEGSIDGARLAAADAAKALRIDVTYVDDLRRPEPFDWRRELVPPLEPPAVAHLRGAFAALRHGDVVVIAYVPGRGTVIRVNSVVVVSAAHHDLMLAFLDHWLGQRPVSEEMKRTLLAPSYPAAHAARTER